MSKEEKDKLKQQKRIEKENKVKEKLDKRLEKIASRKKQSGKVTVSKPTEAEVKKEESTEESKPIKNNWLTRFESKHKVKKSLYDRKDLKREDEKKEKHDYKLAFKEFPVKMVKEVSKIKWAGKKDLTYKFIEVVIFMIVTAAFFYLVDYIFKLIFTAAHVI